MTESAVSFSADSVTLAWYHKLARQAQKRWPKTWRAKVMDLLVKAGKLDPWLAQVIENTRQGIQDRKTRNEWKGGVWYWHGRVVTMIPERFTENS